MQNKKSNPVIGIIGGSGLYEIEGIKSLHWKKVSSSFGKPSDDLCFGELQGIQFVFLPRHGRGPVSYTHLTLPTSDLV